MSQLWGVWHGEWWSEDDEDPAIWSSCEDAEAFCQASKEARPDESYEVRAFPDAHGSHVRELLAAHEVIRCLTRDYKQAVGQLTAAQELATKLKGELEALRKEKDYDEAEICGAV